VANAEDYKSTLTRAKDIKSKWMFWVSYWKPLKEKARSVHTDICSKEKVGVDIFKEAYDLAKLKADNWLQGEERKAEAERRRLQAKADEDARRERERLEKEAGKLKTPELKQQRLEQAAAVEAPVVTVTPPIEKVEGVSVRKVWIARLVDMDKLIAAAVPGSVAASLLEYCEPVGNAYARRTQGKVVVPGLEFFEERISNVRGGNGNGE